MVRVTFFEQLNSFVTLFVGTYLTDRVKAGFIVSAVGTALCYITTRGLFQFQTKYLALFMKVNTG